MKSTLAALTAVALAASAPLANASTNVALGANVTTTGSGFGNNEGWSDPVLAAASTVTDGVFLPTGRQWDTGTLFWGGDANDTSDVVTIQLGGTYVVDALTLQADNNDHYHVSYEDAGGNWHALATIDPDTDSSWGLGTGHASFAPVTATAFSITASGDNAYAVSEFQASGSRAAVPEPASALMLLGGVAALASLARRRVH
jgi:hypothetical protein